MSVNADFDRMALGYGGYRDQDQGTARAERMLSDAIDHQVTMRAAARRERDHLHDIVFIKRVVVIIACLAGLICGAIVAYVVLAYLGHHHVTPAVVHCALVYVRKC